MSNFLMDPNLKKYFDPALYDLRNFVYSFNIASIANGDTEQDTINFNTNSIFLWMKTTYSADIDGAVQTDSSRVIPLVAVQLNNSGADRDIFDQPQRLDNVFGTVGLPNFWPKPMVFEGNSNLLGTFTNLSAATTYVNMQVSLIGLRAYPFGAE